MFQITLPAYNLGYIIDAMPNTKTIASLIARIKGSVTELPAMGEDVTVEASEDDIISAINSLSRAEQGESKPVATGMRTIIEAHIQAGIQAEGQGEEPVLDSNGDPVMVPTSPNDPTLIPLMQPKPWARLLLRLIGIEDAELARRNARAARGWELILKP